MNHTTILLPAASLSVHILLSILVLGISCIAAVQAMVLTTQEHFLRHKKSNNVIQLLPPLESMENWLFQILILGFILLSILLITSVCTFFPVLFTQFLAKTLVSIFAWIMFAVLLLGRYKFGWRGKVAIRWTFSGVFLVMLAFFGSELV